MCVRRRHDGSGHPWAAIVHETDLYIMYFALRVSDIIHLFVPLVRTDQDYNT